MESAIDIIRTEVEAMTFPITINSVVDEQIVTEDGTIDVKAINTCGIYHAQVGYTVSIGGHNYLIRQIDADTNYLYVTGTPAITATSFNLYTPFFFHGVPIEQNIALTQEPDAFNKTPMVWFLENFSEHIYDDNDNQLERDITFRLFFLTQTNNNLWLVDNAYKYAIMPMRSLSESFLDKVRNNLSRFLMEDFEYDVTNYSKFGVYISNRGVLKNMFVDELAGCELSLTLKVYRSNACVVC